MEKESQAAVAHRLVMEAVCGGIVSELKKAMAEEDLTGVGFTIMLFDYGNGGGLAYASTANRQDMIKAMREMIGKLERGA